MADATDRLYPGGANSGGASIATKTLADKVNIIKVLPVDAAGAAVGAGIETTNTPAAVTLVAATAKALLAANAARIRAIIYNPLATPLYVRKAAFATSPATASAGGYDFVIPPANHFISDPYEWAGAYNGICATAGDVNVSESV